MASIRSLQKAYASAKTQEHQLRAKLGRLQEQIESTEAKQKRAKQEYWHEILGRRLQEMKREKKAGRHELQKLAEEIVDISAVLYSVGF